MINGKIETPSDRMSRLQAELDDLETELNQLEKTEWPTQLADDPASSKEQLKVIDGLRSYMETVATSSQFQSLEEKQPIDF